MKVWTAFNMFKGTCFVNCLFMSFAYSSIKFLVLFPSMSKRFLKNIRTTNPFSLTYVTNSSCWIFWYKHIILQNFIKNTGTCFIVTEKKKLWQVGGWEWFYLSWSLRCQLGFLLGSLQWSNRSVLPERLGQRPGLSNQRWVLTTAPVSRGTCTCVTSPVPGN